MRSRLWRRNWSGAKLGWGDESFWAVVGDVGPLR